jgi:hypothetical protein
MGRIQEGVKGKEEKGEAIWDFGCDPIRGGPNSGGTSSKQVAPDCKPHGAVGVWAHISSPNSNDSAYLMSPFKMEFRSNRRGANELENSGATSSGCDLSWGATYIGGLFAI